MPAPAPASAAPGASEASFATVASAVVIGSLAPLMLGVAPVVVGALVERLGFTPAQAGLVISGIKDITPIAHNGCRARKARRV